MTSVNVNFPGRISASFSCENNVRVVGVTGPSGAGKSSLLRAIAGSEKSAVVECSWVSLRRDNADKNVNTRQVSKVGIVFQQPMLFPHVDVTGNFKLAQRHQGVKALSVDKAAAGCCCEHLLDKPISSLSGGEAQRVAIARALINGPDVLLLDESLSAVDVVTRRKIYQFLKQHCEATQTTCIFVSHDLEDLALFSDALVYIEDGKLKYSGSPNDVLSNIFDSGLIDNPSAVLCGSLRDNSSDADRLSKTPFAETSSWPASVKAISIGDQTVYASHQAAVVENCLDSQVSSAQHNNTRKVSVAVKASDVSLDTNVSMMKEAHTSSMLNALLCKVSHIAPLGSNKEAKVLITLSVLNSQEHFYKGFHKKTHKSQHKSAFDNPPERHQTLYASISELSVARLMLKEGMPVLARFKLL